MFRRLLPLLALPVVLGSCQEEVNTLFDEEGVWSMIEVDLSGDGLSEVIDTRENGYMLWFQPSKKGEGIVAAAACVDEGGNASPESSFCHLDGGSTWQCKCFAYEFEDSSMRWLEYEPGSAPPSDVPDIVGGGDTDGTGPTLVSLAAVEGKAFTYIFQPLPNGLFQATESSTFVFQQKSTTTWTNAPTPPASPPDCEMQCM